MLIVALGVSITSSYFYILSVCPSSISWTLHRWHPHFFFYVFMIAARCAMFYVTAGAKQNLSPLPQGLQLFPYGYWIVAQMYNPSTLPKLVKYLRNSCPGPHLQLNEGNATLHPLTPRMHRTSNGNTLRTPSAASSSSRTQIPPRCWMSPNRSNTNGKLQIMYRRLLRHLAFTADLFCCPEADRQLHYYLHVRYYYSNALIDR